MGYFILFPYPSFFIIVCWPFLAKFIFNFCFVFPVSWEGLNCHPDDRKPPEIPKGEIPELKRKKKFLSKLHWNKHGIVSFSGKERSVENSEIRDGKNKETQIYLIIRISTNITDISKPSFWIKFILAKH